MKTESFRFHKVQRSIWDEIDDYQYEYRTQEPLKYSLLKQDNSMEKDVDAFLPLMKGAASHVAQIARGCFRYTAKIHVSFHSNPFYWMGSLVHWL